jgi:hypothetical protein
LNRSNQRAARSAGWTRLEYLETLKLRFRHWSKAVGGRHPFVGRGSKDRRTGDWALSAFYAVRWDGPQKDNPSRNRGHPPPNGVRRVFITRENRFFDLLWEYYCYSEDGLTTYGARHIFVEQELLKTVKALCLFLNLRKISSIGTNHFTLKKLFFILASHPHHLDSLLTYKCKAMNILCFRT